MSIFKPVNRDVLSDSFERDNPEYDPKRDYCSCSPDYIGGVKISKACYLHDCDYSEGKTWLEKIRADNALFRNIYKLLAAKAIGQPWHKRLIIKAKAVGVASVYRMGVATPLSDYMYQKGKDDAD
jgi:hypothetical protein